MTKKTFNQKLNHAGDLPKVESTDDPRFAARYGGSKMLIAAPLDYDAVMKRVPEGWLITSETLRAFLAGRAGADFTCPLTAGIFINIAANASEERAGVDPTPYWRTLRAKGELNEKFPGGVNGHRARLEAEGHIVIQKGKRFFVRDYEKAAWPIEG